MTGHPTTVDRASSGRRPYARCVGSNDEAGEWLRRLRAETEQRAAALEAGFDAVVEAASDVATDDEHDPEGHTIAWERQQLAALLDEARTALDAIDVAERRLEAGTYGVCTSCGSEISAWRLHALPATTICVGCAR